MITNFQQPLPTLDDYCADFRNAFSPHGLTAPGRGRRHFDKRICLDLAASRGQDALVLAIMKEYKARDSLAFADRHGQRSALSYAAEHGYVHTVALLLELKERKLRYRDQHGKNALDYAAGAGHMEMVKFLLRKGCKVDSNMKKREDEMKKIIMLVTDLLPLPPSLIPATQECSMIVRQDQTDNIPARRPAQCGNTPSMRR